MSSACIRSLPLGQNIHMLPQNCILMPNGVVQQVMQNNNKPIAPAPAPISTPATNQTQTSVSSVLSMNGSNIKQSGVNGSSNKKKYTYNNLPYGDQPPSVIRRNARERNRVKQVNNGFVNLRQHIPQTIVSALSSGGRGASKKLSKVDTLRMAVEYIRRLQDLIEESDSDTNSTSTYSQSSSSGSPPPLMTYNENNYDQYNMPISYSDASVSPSPSYSSDLSNNYLQNSPPHPQFKFEPYDSYSMIQDTPDDEEILDYISSWQEQ